MGQPLRYTARKGEAATRPLEPHAIAGDPMARSYTRSTG